MKYNVGQEFTLQTSLGAKQTHIVAIKYEFADYIKGGPKYVTDEELEAYMQAGVLTEGNKLSEKELAIQQIEKKFGIHLQEVDYDGRAIIPE